jgi:hypothetical protein
MAQSYGYSDGISLQMEGPFAGGGTVGKTGEMLLSPGLWKGAVSPFSQEVNVPFVSVNSRVQLQPGAGDLQKLFEQGIALAAENDGGTVTVYAFGNPPDWDKTLSVTAEEVVKV